jgi:hypothetical protein
MVGGSISLDQNSLSRLLDIGERASRAKIQMHNARVDRYIKTQPDLAQYGEFLKIPEPGAYAGTNPAIKGARDAIRRGANPEAVKQRLKDAGIDPTGL